MCMYFVGMLFERACSLSDHAQSQSQVVDVLRSVEMLAQGQTPTFVCFNRLLLTKHQSDPTVTPAAAVSLTGHSYSQPVPILGQQIFSFAKLTLHFLCVCVQDLDKSHRKRRRAMNSSDRFDVDDVTASRRASRSRDAVSACSILQLCHL